MGSQAERADPGLLATRPAPDDDPSSEPRLERPAEESVVRPNLQTSRQVFLVVIRPRHGRGSGPRSSGVENHVTAGRSYRTNVEILAGLLSASRNPASKTKIMGAANVNPRSFQKYFRFCLKYDLVCSTSGGYAATDWGNSVLETIEGVVARAAEIESAVHPLQGSGQSQSVPNGANGSALRHISRWLWNDILVKSENGLSVRRSGGLFARKGKKPESDRVPFRANTPSRAGPLVGETRAFEARIPTEVPRTGEGSRRNGASSRPVR